MNETEQSSCIEHSTNETKWVVNFTQRESLFSDHRLHIYIYFFFTKEGKYQTFYYVYGTALPDLFGCHKNPCHWS